MQKGHITLIKGCMFSGKTSFLIKTAQEYQRNRQKVLVFYPALDNRYKERAITSHDQTSYHALPVHSPSDIVDVAMDVVIIDELQFFDKEIVEQVEIFRNNGKTVVTAGLDLDYRGIAFPVTNKMEDIADKLIHLSALCSRCGEKAYYSQRVVNGKPITKDDNLVVIGGTELYEARCNVHFMRSIQTTT